MQVSDLATIVEISGLPQRLNLALSTFPKATDWLFVAGLALIYTSLALPAGYHCGFLKFDPVSTPQTVLTVCFSSFVSPAFLEEVFFRALLLPHPTETASILSKMLWGCGSLAAFILYHPLNALTFFCRGRQIFTKPVFLGLAGLLGVLCTLVYQLTGSLWPAVFVHWLAVVIWLLLLSGYNRLYSD